MEASEIYSSFSDDHGMMTADMYMFDDSTVQCLPSCRTSEASHIMNQNSHDSSTALERGHEAVVREDLILLPREYTWLAAFSAFLIFVLG